MGSNFFHGSLYCPLSSSAEDFSSFLSQLIWKKVMQFYSSSRKKKIASFVKAVVAKLFCQGGVWSLSFSKFSLEDIFSYYFLESKEQREGLETGERRKKEKEGNIDVREKYQSVAFSFMLKCNPTRDQTCIPSMCLTGIQTGNLSVCGMTPSQLSHTSQGCSLFLKSWGR